MQALPALAARHALFLDFDGTLVDIAARPDAVHVPPATVPLLGALQSRLQGALAIVTGRPVDDIDHFLQPLRLTVAGEHGTLLRRGDGRTQALAPAWPADALAPVLQAAAALVERHPALLLERKHAGLALHSRRAPALQDACRAVLEQARAALPGAELLEGKCVLELKPGGSDKGRAIAALMTEAPFAGRHPLFAGDDVTDEAGFAAVQRLGGQGIKVGAGTSVARLRMANPAALAEWLASALHEDPHSSHPRSTA